MCPNLPKITSKSEILTAIGGGPTIITFTVYTQQDLAHFTLYLNLQGENTNYANSDTYVTYENDDGTTSVTDSHGYIADATITVTQNDNQIPEKKTVRITVEFEEPMGLTNMVAYMWNTDRKATFLKIIGAFEVAAALLEPVMQAADPEPLEPDSELPADPEPVAPDLAGDAADPEPVPSDTLWPDDYDEAQVLHIIRMRSGFEPEFITDTQMLELLGFEDYQDADLPDWMMNKLVVLIAKGDIAVGQFMLAPVHADRCIVFGLKIRTNFPKNYYWQSKKLSGSLIKLLCIGSAESFLSGCVPDATHAAPSCRT